MNDNDDDVPAEVKEIVDKGVAITAIMCSIDDPVAASKTIAVAIAHLLCFRMKDEDSAHEMFNMIIDDVDAAVLTTKKFSCTSWSDGTPH